MYVAVACPSDYYNQMVCVCGVGIVVALTVFGKATYSTSFLPPRLRAGSRDICKGVHLIASAPGRQHP